MRAKNTDRPILLSVGYSACHWCDVNDVMTKIEPLLNVLLIPATYLDLHTMGGGLRVDTGDVAATGTTLGSLAPCRGWANWRCLSKMKSNRKKIGKQ